jgi:hypothetical protein
LTRRAFLHIGLPKTGTTYLQHALWTNKDALRADGVLLPGVHRRRHLLASLDVRQDPKLARRSGDVSAPWQGLVAECQAWDGTVVISHEFFGAASTEQVARVRDSLAGFEVHVLVTARSMTGLGPSRWQEWVKSGGKLGIDAYPPRKDYDPTDEWGWGSFDLASILERWGSVVAHPRIHVLPVDPSLPANDLWLRFADVLGLDGSRFPVSSAPVNRSLGVVEVELLRRVNPFLGGFTSAGDRGTWIRGYLGEGDVLPQRRERFRVGEAKQRELDARGRRAIELLAAGGFDVRGDPSLLEPAPTAGLRHPDDVTDAELLEAASITIANMLGDVRSLTLERDSALRGRDELARQCEALSSEVAHLRVPPLLRRLRRLRAAVTRDRPSEQGERT